MYIVFTLACRPFYLLGALFAVLSSALWIADWLGFFQLKSIFPSSYFWHIHEMLWGFVAAIIAGFLLTAVETWTGRRALAPIELCFLVCIWVAARIAVVTGPLELTFVVDCLFLPLVALAMARAILPTRNIRNSFAIVVPLVMTLCNLAVYGALYFAIPQILFPMFNAMLMLVMLIVAIIGGRVIPFFIKRALPESHPVVHPLIEKLAIASLLVVVLLIAMQMLMTIPQLAFASAYIAVAVVHAIRWWLWHPVSTLSNPLLWILLVSYGWLPIAFICLAFAAFGMMQPSLGVHILTVGTIGGMIMGMMTRTTRGHTGRPLTAGSVECVLYLCMIVAVVFRSLLPIVFPASMQELVTVSVLLWSIAFLIFAFYYGRWLLTPTPSQL